MSTDRHDRSDLDAKTDVGPGTGRGVTPHAPEEAEFDREINLRGVLWTGAILVAVALVVHLLIWWLLRGFSTYDKKHDVRLTPIEAASPQPPPPEPRLQIDPNEDMRRMREAEDALIDHAAWVNRQQGTVRVPLDVAIDVIAARGVSPEVVGGTGAAMAREASPPGPLSLTGEGERNRNVLPVPPLPSGRGGQGVRPRGQTAPPGREGPPR
ncbi:MAG TPA: hypothetical protein VGG03_15785 [Thermoanaerobaculia bacterium]|jgi:hypothetical protein